MTCDARILLNKYICIFSILHYCILIYFILFNKNVGMTYQYMIS